MVGEHGGLDVLVSCVGLFDFYRGARDLARDDVRPAFDELFHANVASPLLAVHAALDALTASRGAVVLTCSTSGFYAGRGGVLYVASKFAVRGLVVALAHELAPDIRVNAVAPGGTARDRPAGPIGTRARRRVARRPPRAGGRAQGHAHRWPSPSRPPTTPPATCSWRPTRRGA